MSAKDQWYEDEKWTKGNLLDFRKQIVNYCQMDVTVLRLCCQQFRPRFLEILDGICPFVSATTNAGLCDVY